MERYRSQLKDKGCILQQPDPDEDDMGYNSLKSEESTQKSAKSNFGKMPGGALEKRKFPGSDISYGFSINTLSEGNARNPFRQDKFQIHSELLPRC